MKPIKWISTLPRRAWALAFSGLGLAFAAGVVFWGGFNTVMEWTNTEAFCISCHEMKQNVYQEYRNTVHYSNRTGVRAVCSDCHVPKEWGPKMLRKLYASNELLHHFLGTIDTPEKFEAKRATLAQNEWRRMKANNSQECRNCHDYSYFDYTGQGARSARMHQQGLESGQTCIDCHKGVAHSLPAIEQSIGQPKPGGVPAQALHPR
ncbi:NapC/NirT family cytochrome c [Bordetella petrii]|uniref:NapC/NirT family cytochrome c n=1 Tax=Bordetella petrii TaxID=94624 RepID=UPI001E3EEEDF|nr:NapC/NirT family cytochrome c [Bordetella petrii]MCD0501421.1 NapC/NirT family cytochrome c [Bordetella petrii]